MQSQDKSLKHLQRKIINQESQYEYDFKIKKIKNKITGKRHQRHSDILNNIKKTDYLNIKRLKDINQKLRASVWISSLEIEEKGYAITKQRFWDLAQICYEWEYATQKHEYAGQFNLQHALLQKRWLYDNTTRAN